MKPFSLELRRTSPQKTRVFMSLRLPRGMPHAEVETVRESMAKRILSAHKALNVNPGITRSEAEAVKAGGFPAHIRELKMLWPTDQEGLKTAHQLLGMIDSNTHRGLEKAADARIRGMLFVRGGRDAPRIDYAFARRPELIRRIARAVAGELNEDAEYRALAQKYLGAKRNARKPEEAGLPVEEPE